MFLFENFTYDPEWAKNHYSNFKSTWSYLDDIIRDYDYVNTLDYEHRKQFIFSIHTLNSSLLMNFNGKVFTIQTYFDSDSILTPYQKSYIIDRLSKLGAAITILDKNFNDGKSIAFLYDITKDEYRWNLEHEKIRKHEEQVNAINLPEPELEDWLWMLNNMYDRKNARIIFKKIKDNETLLKYFIIAYKLNWAKAFFEIKSQLIFNADKKINYDQAGLIEEAVKQYAKEYKPDETIQDLINDYGSSFKNDGVIPTKGKPFAKKLDENHLVKRYKIVQPSKTTSWTPVLIIEVETTNGKVGCISLQHVYIYRLSCWRSREDIGNYGKSFGKDNKFGQKIIHIVESPLEQAIKEIYEEGRPI